MADTKTLIIPDIHNNYLDAELIISSECPDKTIFLGDYFDSFGDTLEQADQTAYWLSESIQKTDRIHLIGNHDLGYITDLSHLKCSGYTDQKKHVIDMRRIKWDKLKLYYFLDDWLCTHAGISKQFFEHYGRTSLRDFMAQSSEDLSHINDTKYDHRFLQCGWSRGGQHEHGGILWCDYGEFEDIAGQKQIFGHTCRENVRQTANHICLDTALTHYAVYQNKKMIIKEFKKQ